MESRKRDVCLIRGLRFGKMPYSTFRRGYISSGEKEFYGSKFGTRDSSYIIDEKQRTTNLPKEVGR